MTTILWIKRLEILGKLIENTFSFKFASKFAIYFSLGTFQLYFSLGTFPRLYFFGIFEMQSLQTTKLINLHLRTSEVFILMSVSSAKSSL